MSHPPFSPDWLSQFTDPYAVLGVSVAADDRRILKRYHYIAKQLHPDVQAANAAEHQTFINQTLAKLVNPAYQRLKQEKHRSETLATLRFKARRLNREGTFQPQGTQGRHLLTASEIDVDMVYEHALDQLSEHQYESATSFAECTQLIAELNLVYLQRKMGEPIIREKRTGLVGTTPPRQPATKSTAASASPESATGTPAKSYADRHLQRARDYLKAQNAPAAIEELKDALKIEPHNSTYHCLMGQAYLLHNLTGMAKVHIKQALRFDPTHSVALKYARQLKIDLNPTPAADAKNSPAPKSMARESGQGRFLSRLFSKRQG